MGRPSPIERTTVLSWRALRWMVEDRTSVFSPRFNFLLDLLVKHEEASEGFVLGSISQLCLTTVRFLLYTGLPMLSKEMEAHKELFGSPCVHPVTRLCPRTAVGVSDFVNSKPTYLSPILHPCGCTLLSSAQYLLWFLCSTFVARTVCSVPPVLFLGTSPPPGRLPSQPVCL